ncbi:hypothetical protein [Halogeometricum sp. CBA1124]|uniref:hypothetical protein n=1 Tax=Halogeometricum sp. CBA1124 TaxID=2668071 RepID=UPI00142A0665|nr:hypothetical protein [Halogeometricum sp. CBA1124]MUV57243.1 hypothetical protein [Halogeometricum sp. CBA1124]
MALFGLLSVITRTVRLQDRNSLSITEPRYLPIFAGWATAIIYWTITAESFVFNVSWWARRIVTDLFGQTASNVTGDSTVALGTALPPQTVQTALAQLASVNSLYLTALAAVFSLGIVTVLESPGTFKRSVSLVSVSTLSAAVVFKTPLVIPGLNRIRMPFAFFFAIVLGIGVYRLIRSASTPSVTRVLPLALFLVLATTAPLYVLAGDDLYDLHDPPDGPPQKQVEFSETEYRSLEAVAQFTERHEGGVQTFWIDGLAIEQFGKSPEPGPEVTDTGIYGDSGLFLYRTGWADHLVHYAGDSWGKFILSREWLETTVENENKVYDSGTAGLLWSADELRLPDHESETEASRSRRLSRGFVAGSSQ